MIDAHGATPLYEQVKEDLLLRIRSEQFKPSQKIPSEKELASYYGVSIITIRHAISQLVSENVLEKKQGKGTYILRKPFQRPFDQAVSFSEVCAANGMKASAKLLSGATNYNPSAKVVAQLNLAEGSKIIQIERLRFADDYPVVIETVSFPMRYAFLLDMDLDNASLHNTLRAADKNITFITKPGTRTLKIIRADAKTAKLLQISKGGPILSLEGLCYNGTTGEPLYATYHAGYSDHLDFSMTI